MTNPGHKILIEQIEEGILVGCLGLEHIVNLDLDMAAVPGLNGEIFIGTVSGVLKLSFAAAQTLANYIENRE